MNNHAGARSRWAAAQAAAIETVASAFPTTATTRNGSRADGDSGRTRQSIASGYQRNGECDARKSWKGRSPCAISQVTCA